MIEEKEVKDAAEQDYKAQKSMYKILWEEQRLELKKIASQARSLRVFAFLIGFLFACALCLLAAVVLINSGGAYINIGS